MLTKRYETIIRRVYKEIFNRIADDKIEEHWGELDIPSMQEQLQGITQAQA